MIWHLTLALSVLTLSATEVFADPPASTFHAVTITTSSGILKGYTLFPASIDVKKPDYWAKVKADNQRIAFWTKLVKIAAPFEMVVSVEGPPKIVDVQAVRKVEFVPDEISGRQIQGLGIPEISPALAKLLQGKPNYQCAPTYAEKGVYWLSFNKAIGEPELDDICTASFEEPPSEAVQAAMMKKKGVVRFYYDVD